MSAGIKNIDPLEQGTHFSMGLTVKTASDVVKDLTGHTVAAQLRRSFSSTTAIDFVCDIPTPANGVITLELSPETTAALMPGTYVYDVELTETATGYVQRLLQGVVKVSPEVTR